MQRTVTRQMSFDLTKLLVTEDWFSDISPQSMRRLLNIVSVTGRLLRANQITFNWDRLASWINLTEEWPYRTSWLILFLEENDIISDQVTLKTTYERISKNIPTTKDVEPLLEIDGDIRSFEVFLSSRTPVLTAQDVEMFLPCTVNLDPKLREIIADVRDAREQMHIGGVSYPTLPLQEAPVRQPSVFGHAPAACSPAGSFPAGGLLPPQPPSSYFSGLTGPQHPFYNRPYFPHHVYHLPRHYPGNPLHVLSRPPSKLAFPKDPSSGLGSGSAVPSGILSSLSTDGVCERLKQIEGLDASMLEQYATTIKKANIGGRVLCQCNLEELRAEMSMNFGDWHLFKAMVLEQRQAESQALQDECRGDREQGTRILPEAPARAAAAAPPSDGAMRYSLNLSFEELSTAGLEECSRQPTNQWPAASHRTSSMSSLNSQESSNDISKLTDRQQAEYHSAYQDYISQMAQLEVPGPRAERAAQPLPAYLTSASSEDRAKEGEQEGRKNKRSPKPVEGMAEHAAGPDTNLLHPITEEDEKSDSGGAGRASPGRSRGAAPQYRSVPSEEDESGPEDTDATPLLWEQQRKEARAGGGHRPGLAAAKGFALAAALDKKESSDSGMRSSGSSSDPSLQDEESEWAQEEEAAEETRLIELLPGSPARKRSPPRSLSGGLRDDAAAARMSICSEAASEVSLAPSSPEESWPASAVTNLNCAVGNTTLAVANNNNGDEGEPANGPPLVIGPGSSTDTPNQNLLRVHVKMNTSARGHADRGEERESVL